LRSEAGEAQPVARRAIVHKSTGAKVLHGGKFNFYWFRFRIEILS
jgi:hypothetical protein